RDEATGALTAANPYHLDFGDRTAFFACDGARQSFTCDRAEFLGAGGSTLSPHAVRRNVTLSDTIESGRDPCAAIACEVEVEANGTVDLTFVLGDAASGDRVPDLASRHLGADFDARLAA